MERLTNWEIDVLQKALDVLADSITEWTEEEYEYCSDLSLLSLKLERLKDMYPQK